MNILIAELNWLGTIIATVIYSAFSGIWHRPFAFGKRWEKAMGFERPEDWKETNIYYIVPLIGCFIASLSMAFLHSVIDITTLRSAVLLGLIVGFGIGTTVTFTNAVIPIMKNPIIFALITGTAHAISITLVSIILYLTG